MTRAPSAPRAPSAAPEPDRSTTFTPNQGEPIHRWFRYSAGFSAAWAEQIIAEHGRAPGRGPATVLDPFAGSGTVLLAAQRLGAPSVGCEAHPFVARVARAKLAWSAPPERLRTAARALLERATTRSGDAAARSGDAAAPSPPGPELLERIFTPEHLGELLCLRAALAERLAAAGPGDRPGEQLALWPRFDPEGELLWLALAAILRPCAHAGTAPWQYVLPSKRKARPARPFDEFGRQIERMAEDMARFAGSAAHPLAPAVLHEEDARRLTPLAPASIDLVLTSPPYPNNYDYADATRIEMSFFGEVERWGDLHQAVRRHLIRSCSQHSATERLELPELLADPRLRPILDELGPVCAALDERRQDRGGRKTYHTMIAAYFSDMAAALAALARVLRPGGLVCLVIGDSAPYGVHVPVERWLGQLGEPVGLGVLRFEETRQRNIKWRNRKHRVPLREGRLWLRRE